METLIAYIVLIFVFGPIIFGENDFKKITKGFYKFNLKGFKVANFFILILINILSFVVNSLSKLISHLFYKINGNKLTLEDLEMLKILISNMEPRRFEEFCTELYRLNGYDSQITSATNDGGKDIILKRYNETIYVECKHYTGSVGKPIAQKLYGAMASENVRHGVIITTGYFTSECKQYCRKMNIEMVDLDGIIGLCKSIGTSEVLMIAKNT